MQNAPKKWAIKRRVHRRTGTLGQGKAAFVANRMRWVDLPEIGSNAGAVGVPLLRGYSALKRHVLAPPERHIARQVKAMVLHHEPKCQSGIRKIRVGTVTNASEGRL